MSKWIIYLLVGFIALAVVGFLVDAARFLIGVALLGVIAVVAWQFIRGKSGGRNLTP